MSFLLKWLRIDKPQGAGLRPSRSVEVALPFDAAFDRCTDGIERVLGGVVRESDRAAGTIEATFGLAFSERLTCTFESLDAQLTRARIESRRGAQAEA
ncbi:MAG TPA: hypothetical protein VIG51_00630, partial [Candidatus Baltobacteraceae bacterium]